MDENVETFWANFEKETGEPVIAKTMGQYFASPKDRGDWGLLVLSPTGFRFRKTPGENWFASLFKASSFKASSPPVPQKSEDDIVIPYAAMSKVSTPPKKLLDFLFGSPFRIILISCREAGGEKEMRFAVDPKCDFPDKLAENVAASGANAE